MREGLMSRRIPDEAPRIKYRIFCLHVRDDAMSYISVFLSLISLSLILGGKSLILEQSIFYSSVLFFLREVLQSIIRLRICCM